MPESVRLVLIGRHAPPLPLSRLRMLGELHEIGMQDLRFSPEETAELVEKSLRRKVPAAAAELLCAKTEGWAAGIRIAAVNLRDEEHPEQWIRNFSGAHPHVADYAAEELIAQQPEHVRKFLLYTSILDRFSLPLGRAVAGTDAAPAAHSAPMPAADPDAAGLFMIPLDDDVTWYRYPRMIRESLEHLLRRSVSPEQLAEAHRRAFRRFAEERMYPEAIAHAAAAEDYPELVEYVSRLLDAAPEAAHGIAFEPWLEDVPVRLWLDRPTVFIYLASAMILRGKTIRAGRFVDEAERIIRQNPKHHLDENAASLLRSISVLRTGIMLADDFSRILDHVDDAMTMIRWCGRHTDFWNRGEVRLSRSYVGLGGKIKTGLEVYTRMQADPKHSIFFYETLKGFGQVMLAELYYESNDTENASALLAQAMPAVSGSGKPALLVPAHYLKARLELAAGRTDEAFAALEEAAERIRALRSDRWLSLLETAAVGLKLQLGCAEDGLRWLEKRFPEIPDQPSVPDEFEQFVLVRALMAAQRTIEAVHRLMLLYQFAKDQKRLGSEIEALLLLALCAKRQGDLARAFRLLEEALVPAEAERHARVFLDEGAEMAELLAGWLKAGVPRAGRNIRQRHVQYVSGLLNMFEEGERDRQKQARPVPPLAAALLTDREYEILLRIAGGATNEAVAKELHLAVGTVKRYTHHLFQKLDARNRVEAIAAAQKLGIL